MFYSVMGFFLWFVKFRKFLMAFTLLFSCDLGLQIVQAPKGRMKCPEQFPSPGLHSLHITV